MIEKFKLKVFPGAAETLKHRRPCTRLILRRAKYVR